MRHRAPILAASGVARRGDDGRSLLGGIDLEVSGGDRIGVSGPSGAGKSQLLRALALLDPLAAGEVLWRGAPLADTDVPRFRSRVVYVQQSPGLLEGSVEENLRLPFALRVHAGRAYEPATAERLIGRLGRSGDLLRAAVGDLSGGERQIVALVRVLQLEPDVLLLDEPTAALDPETEGRVIELLTSWAGSGDGERAYLWVTHDRRVRSRVARRAYEVRDGRLSEEGDDD